MNEITKDRIREVLRYPEHGWPIFPVKNKKPLTPHGFKDATLDLAIIQGWLVEHPNCDWAVPTGTASGIWAIDIDKPEMWEEIVQRFDTDDTFYTLSNVTPSGGEHLVFQYDSDRPVKTSAGKVGDGIDVRAEGGYIVIPPSKGYSWEGNFPKDVTEAPEWAMELVTRTMESSKALQTSDTALATQDEDIAYAVLHLNALDPTRAENYQNWLEVGMALSGLGEIGLTLWDNWSKQSTKYKLGECSEKWRTFTHDDGLTAESLRYWALEDSPEYALTMPRAPKTGIKPSDYKKAMIASGWEFRMNEASHDIEINGIPLAKPIEAVLMNQLRENGYKQRPVAMDCFIELGFKNRYHPVNDYLERLVWDGGDHITKLADYFKDEDDVFGLYLKRWLIGAIARIYEHGERNRMLVLDGPQMLGKSYFVRWLAGEVPNLHLEGPIKTEDKDNDIRLMSVWIWEVAELNSTIRKADRDSLKFFISKNNVTVRKPYDSRDTVRPAMTSFIGTINNEVGFLSDPTGHTRFMACTLISINWNYSKEVEVGQVWAQAMALYRAGEAWRLEDNPEEFEKVTTINKKYELDDPLAETILDIYRVEPKNNSMFTPTRDIISSLKINGHITGPDRRSSMIIGSILKKFGCTRDRKRVGGQPLWGWYGIDISAYGEGGHIDDDEVDNG